MTNIANANPRMVYRGINDVSGRQVTPEPEEIPMHFPFFFTLAEKGVTIPQLITNNANEVFGAGTFDYRQKFANHQTPFIKHTIKKANSCFIQRLIPHDAKESTMVLFCAISDSEVSEVVRFGYRRQFDNGVGITDGESVNRRLIQWFTEELPRQEGQPTDSALASLKTLEVSKTIEIDGTQVAFTAKPVLAFTVVHGESGDNIGINLTTPTLVSADPVNEDLAMDQDTLLHRLKFVQRIDPKSKPSVVKTLTEGQYAEFSFKENVIDKKLDAEMSFEKVVPFAWKNEKPEDGTPPVYGPYGSIEFFRENYESILDIVVTSEQAMFDDGNLKHLYNIFDAIDINGDKYYSFRVLRPAEDRVSINFGDNTVLYASGGSDGTCTTEMFNQLVREACATWGDMHDLLDAAYWDYSAFWDSGFDLETKKSLISVMGKRQDCWVGLGTHVHGDTYSTVQEEQSMATAIKGYVGMYPESTYFGTQFVRGICVPGSSRMVDKQCPWHVSSLINVLDKVCGYMGNGQGVMRKGKDFDQYPGNVVEIITDIANAWKSTPVRNKDWSLGLSTIQRFDRRSFFMPAIQTLYEDDTSVINSAVNMWIAVECAKVCRRAWARMTGTSKLTKEQFIERSNRTINDLIDGKFDDRVTITPRTYFSPADNMRGYSWHCELHVQMNSMMTVGTFSVVVDRKEG